MRRAAPALITVIAGIAAAPVGAATRPPTQTLVFDAFAHNRFIDVAPAGPSPGDTEVLSSKLRDASGRIVGSAHGKCVFTKVLANDVLEQCTERARSTDGAVTLKGVGHLESMNPPWRVIGRSGAYKGLTGTLGFEADIPLDPNVPLAAGRLFSVAVITVATNRPLHAGVVPRPAANNGFIRRANSDCRAAERKSNRLPGFPFPSFDPFHPDPTLLPQVGMYFNQPARRHLPRVLLRELKKLGPPPASRAAWHNVLRARRTVLANETAQIKAALADNAPTFVRTVYQQSRDYNKLVFTSAVFGVESCTFS